MTSLRHNRDRSHMKDIMASETQSRKQLTIRCTEDFWVRIGIAARRARMSVTTLVIQAAERELARREDESSSRHEGTAA